MINLRESHNQYQKLSLLFVSLLGIVMTFISVPASGYSEAWGGCLIPVGTETATGPVISMVKLQDNKQELIVAWKGLFLLDNKLKQVAIIDHEIIGEITAIQKLPGIDEVLIGAINGVFLYDAAFGSGLGRKIIDLSIFSFATCAGSTVLGIGALVSERPQKVTSRRTFSFP
ncbi:hypothetical protein ACXDTH_001642 [Klebsiella variicola]|uniref:hypothetical protein n=1 Tax=Klebsiella variicola TaxID=244366 RepID=UPI0015A75326|nr:hypothetical protein [Klebsiella variicola]